MLLVSDIKLIRTDTTLDLSQKAEKGMLLHSPPSHVLLPRPSSASLQDGVFHTKLSSSEHSQSEKFCKWRRSSLHDRALETTLNDCFPRFDATFPSILLSGRPRNHTIVAYLRFTCARTVVALNSQSSCKSTQ